MIGRAKFNVFAVRAEELIEDRPELIAVVGPLLKARKAIEQQTDDLDRKVLKLARYDGQVRRFMTVPGVGPITALCFKATIDDPTRFRRSRSVGAYVGLTTRRYASGEIDWTGRISKSGDAMLRSYLFEAAGVEFGETDIVLLASHQADRLPGVCTLLDVHVEILPRVVALLLRPIERRLISFKTSAISRRSRRSPRNSFHMIRRR